jgi:nitroimidazol reductase NimA-like FMN-containing flavoprotein (pyridoxamine 5'-phosphate oxidase superfamily)
MFIQEMSESDCFKTLARARLGRLACAHDNQPYVVPIYFVYEGPYLYVLPYLYAFTTLGQKVEWMRSNPLVCVELDEMENSDQWTSILIFGRYEELPDTPEGKLARLHAHGLLQKHGSWWEPGGASHALRNPDQPLTPIFYRIRIDRITGRRATPSPGGPVGSRTSPPSRDSEGWLRKFFQALTRPFVGR